MRDEPALDEYWAWRWLGAKDIRTIGDITRALDKNGLDDLTDFATRCPRVTTKPAGEVVVAGWGLGSVLWRSHGAEDASDRVDILLRRTWHYYDAVIVEDSIRHDLEFHARDSIEHRRRRLTSLLVALLHIRQIGAIDLIRFRDKPKICGAEWRDHAEREGLVELIEIANDLSARIQQEGRVTVESARGFRDVVVRHRFLPKGITRIRYRAGISRQVLVRDAVERAMASQYAYLRSDLVTANRYSSPLGLADDRATAILERTSNRSAMFELELPFLENVPVPTLLQMRADMGDLFADFQSALREATTSLQSAEVGAHEISRRIESQIIEPELRRIRKTLDSARNTLIKKSLTGVALGVAAATVGLLFGVPLAASAVAGIAAAGAATNTGVGKYFDTQEDIRKSNFFFLWKAQARSGKTR